MADPAGASGRENPVEPRSGPPYAGSRRACDACHSRKIRCNKESPCAHCSRAGLVCKFTADQSKEKRTRILLTPQYEKKLDRMDRRLNDIAEMLEELKNDASTKNHLCKHIVHTPDLAGMPAEILHSCSTGLNNTPPDTQADSTMAAHSEFAHDIIQKAVTSQPFISHKPEMRKFFDELKDTIRSFGPSDFPSEMSYPNATPIQRHSLLGCEMPPIDKVVQVIRNPNYQDMMRISGLSPFFQLNNLADLSLGIYFSRERPETDFVTVNFGLHYLFQAYASQVVEAEREECLRFATMCRNNIDTGLSNLPLYLSPTAGTIVALLCGTYYSLDISQPHLAWTLISKASELCQTLGYHHAGNNSQNSKEEIRHKQRLFWLFYIMEKSLSLRLGRSSTIQDWDVTVPLPESMLDGQTSEEGLVPLLALSVKIARCQGNIHELLYSQTSLALPDQARYSRVQALGAQLGEVGKNISASIENTEKFNTAVGFKNSNLILLHSLDIAHLSLLTLVYRASPRLGSASVFSEQCIEKARVTLERLHRFLELIQGGTGHVPATAYNTLLYSPIPFIVMFCNSIESHNRSDLACLHDFNTLLMSAPPSSGPIARMKRLFHALYIVALHYVEIRTTHGGPEQTHADAEMDSCLSMLGMNVSDPVNQQQQGIDPGQLSNHAASVAPEGTGGGIRRESMNPWVWMDNILQPDDFVLW